MSNISASSIIIGIFIVCAIFAGSYSLVDFWSQPQNYNIPLSNDYRGSFNQTTQLSEKISTQWNKVKNDWTINPLIFWQLVPDGFKLLLAIFDMPLTVLQVMATTVSTTLGFDSWVLTFFIPIIMVIIIFTLLSTVFRMGQ